jgi:ubiquinone/menaquinone biosynthesis C-methylase UbiE
MSENLCDEVSQAYDVWSISYDFNTNPTRDLSETVLRSNFVEKYLTESRSLDILEIGCGTGRNIQFFVEKFSSKIGSYSAVDISDGMMNKAKQKIKTLNPGLFNEKSK